MKRLLTLSTGMLLCLAASAADQPKTTDGQHAYLEVIMENKTTRGIDETAVFFGERRCTFGTVGAGATAGYLGWNSPVGTNAVVQWRDAQKTRHEKTVSLVEVYKRREPGALLFSVTTTNVSVSFKKIDRK
jgi:hypothetical protein